MVPSTVDLSFVVEVDQVHQQFTARGAGETRRVPAQPGARPRSEHRHFSTADVLATLEYAERLDYTIPYACKGTCRRIHTVGSSAQRNKSSFGVFALLMIVVCVPVPAGFF